MPGTERAEIYFIAGMMVLTLIVSFTAVYFFARQYRKEMREKEARRQQKAVEKQGGSKNVASENA